MIPPSPGSPLSWFGRLCFKPQLRTSARLACPVIWHAAVHWVKITNISHLKHFIFLNALYYLILSSFSFPKYSPYAPIKVNPGGPSGWPKKGFNGQNSFPAIRFHCQNPPLTYLYYYHSQNDIRMMLERIAVVRVPSLVSIAPFIMSSCIFSFSQFYSSS